MSDAQFAAHRHDLKQVERDIGGAQDMTDTRLGRRRTGTLLASAVAAAGISVSLASPAIAVPDPDSPTVSVTPTEGSTPEEPTESPTPEQLSPQQGDSTEELDTEYSPSQDDSSSSPMETHPESGGPEGTEHEGQQGSGDGLGGETTSPSQTPTEQSPTPTPRTEEGPPAPQDQTSPTAPEAPADRPPAEGQPEGQPEDPDAEGGVSGSDVGEDPGALTCTAQSSPMLSPGDRATITLVSDSSSAQVTFSDGSASKTTIHRVQASLAEAGNGAHTLTLEVPDHVAQTVDDGVQVLVSDGERTATCHASFTLLSGGTDPQAADVAADQRSEDEDDQVDADEDGTDEADDGESERTPQPTERDDEAEDDADEPAEDETSASPASSAEESPSESVEAEGAVPTEEITETGASNLVIGSAVMVVLLGAGALVMARRHRMQ
ncbi:hypothetical protein [Nesterenkonia marinintestina]|uniref:hypothetical protein n=1 Tax=Nesterenkonia marinintestina TaxID=2979865 RepID=UPI0021C20DFA|nr:hypothetical protein [Nesterenkonia sp. GX14115]